MHDGGLVRSAIALLFVVFTNTLNLKDPAVRSQGSAATCESTLVNISWVNSAAFVSALTGMPLQVFTPQTFTEINVHKLGSVPLLMSNSFTYSIYKLTHLNSRLVSPVCF